jgi:hypothetical protein
MKLIVMTTPYADTVQTVRESLTKTFDQLDQQFELPADVRSFRPTVDTWSIDEILEHVTLTSHYLLIIIRKGCAKAQRKAEYQQIEKGQSDLNRMTNVGHPDAFPWIRPEHMEPTRSTPTAEVRTRMKEQLNECLSLLSAMPKGEGSLYKVRMSVQDLGKMNMYEWLYFLALHGKRHQVEIDRLREKWASQS